MRAFILWNIIAIACLGLPAYILICASIELLQIPSLFSLGIALIFLLLVVFVVLIANIVTIWNEDREEKKKEEVR